MSNASKPTCAPGGVHGRQSARTWSATRAAATCAGRASGWSRRARYSPPPDPTSVRPYDVARVVSNRFEEPGLEAIGQSEDDVASASCAPTLAPPTIAPTRREARIQRSRSRGWRRRARRSAPSRARSWRRASRRMADRAKRPPLPPAFVTSAGAIHWTRARVSACSTRGARSVTDRQGALWRGRSDVPNRSDTREVLFSCFPENSRKQRLLQ